MIMAIMTEIREVDNTVSLGARKLLSGSQYGRRRGGGGGGGGGGRR